jgi:Na+-driven multidrug efflux pump
MYIYNINHGKDPPGPIAHSFTSDAAVLAEARKAMPLVALMQVCSSFLKYVNE